LFEFDHSVLVLTEADSKCRASLHLVEGEAALAAMNPGGLEVFDCDRAAFAKALRRENHTLKRVLTDPHNLSGSATRTRMKFCIAPNFRRWHFHRSCVMTKSRRCLKRRVMC
jgi:hypothetical protein